MGYFSNLAISDLRERYGICVGEQVAQEAPVVDEITDIQISFQAYSQHNSPCVA